MCISSLHVNNQQIFVGRNADIGMFVLDGDRSICSADQMSTPLLTIQNGEVVTSACKGMMHAERSSGISK